MARRNEKRTIGIVIYPEAEVLDITGPHEVFSMAAAFQREQRSAGPYEIFLVARTLQPVKMSSGMKLLPDYRFDNCPVPPDTLIIPGAEAIEQAIDDPPVLQWVEQQSGKVRRLVSICTGAFFLAKLGLLDGKRVTTHWGYCQLLQKTYPNVNVVPDAIYIRQGNIYTSAGITAGMDLALALVEEDTGKDIAMSIARKLVLFYKRPGGQKQFSEFLLSQSSSLFNELIEWIMQNLSGDLTIEKLAEQANMSPRNFTRLFKKELEQTPGKFIERLRLRHARILLENRTAALKEIAGQCGFKSEEQMRRAFQRELRVTPQEYRTRF
ncbi:MAG TPA: GlxA family transcriptional regulator [Gammaproteobacteria bacterium]|nr:GlxA family transcriptional regulator [Gammaproteobacteria bacterium]